MAWFIGGFVLVVAVESLIRVLSNYEPESRERTRKVQVSMPWWGWGLAGLATWGSLKKDKRK